LPPHVCRVFTAENYLHRASVEDVVSTDKLRCVVERTRGKFFDRLCCCNRERWQFRRSGYNGDANGFTSNLPTSFRLLPRENEPMSSLNHPIEPVEPIQPPVKHASEPPAQRPTVPPLVPPIQRPTVPPPRQPLQEPNRTPLIPPVREPNRTPLIPPVREPNRTPLIPPVQEPNPRPPLRPPVQEPNRTPLVPPIDRPD
jgi:hypothetical protein